MPFGQPDSLGHFLDRGELTGVHPPPPQQCAADGAQDIGGLGSDLRRSVVVCQPAPIHRLGRDAKMVVAQRLKPGEHPVDPILLLGGSHKRK